MGSIKVNLGVSDDLGRIREKYTSTISDLDSQLRGLQEAKDAVKKANDFATAVLKKAKDAVSNAQSVQDSGNSSVSEAETMAKSLGLAASAVPNYSEVKKLYSDIENSMKSVNNFTI